MSIFFFNTFIKFVITLCVFILFSPNLSGQNKEINKLQIIHSSDFQSYPSYPVYCLEDFYRDSQGKIWLTTCLVSNQSSTGLISFDGYKFEKASAENAVLNSVTKHFIGISNDKIYGYSNLDSLSLLFFYDTKKNTFKVYDSISINKQLKLFNEVNLENEVPPIFQRLEKDTIYTYFRRRDSIQLFTYDENLKRLEYKPYVLPDYSSTKVNADFSANKEWYFIFDYRTSAISSLNLITGNQHALEAEIDDKKLTINKIGKKSKIEWQDGYLIIKTPSINGYYKYIYKRNGNKNDKIEFIDKFKSYYGRAIFVDELGQSIIHKKLVNKSYLELTTKNSGTYDISVVGDILSSRDIKKIYADNFLNELYILTSRDFHVVKLGNRNTINKIETESPVRGLDMIDDKNLIYLEETGLNSIRSIDIETGKIDKKPDICEFIRLNLLRRNDSIWGVTKGGFASYDTTSGVCTTYPINQDILTFQLDRLGNIVFTDVNNEFWKYVPDSGEIEHLDITLSKLDRFPSYVDFIVDDNDILWVINHSGLLKYDLKLHTSERINQKIPNFNYNLISIAKGKKDELWLGSFDSGLIIFNTQNYKFKTISSQDGLPNNSVASVTKDKQGYYWIGTYRGIAVLNKEAQIMTTLYESDGLVNNEANRRSAKLLPDGRLALGTIDGISLIDPERITSNFEEDKDINLYFTSISYYDKYHKDISTIKYGFEDVNELVLPPGKSNVSLEFANTNYINPLENKYAYKIEGISDDWISIGTNNKLDLYSLPAGKYPLKIKTGYYRGNWSGNVLELDLVVDTFFYNKIWFYIIVLIVVAIASILMIWVLNKRIKIATQKIYLDKKRIESQANKLKELDQAKGEFFTNITHEFRTPLTIIKGITQVLKEKYAKDSTKEFYDIEQNSNHLLDMVNQILDLKKLESNKLQLNLFQADITMYTNYIVDSHQFLAKQKHIKLEAGNTDGKVIMDFDPDKLRIVLSNLISNAIKFTPQNGFVSINLKYNEPLNSADIIIKDSGKGFSDAELEKAFELYYQSHNALTSHQKGSGIGLYYAKKLIELMNGSIAIKSRKGKGTCIKISLPLTNKAKHLNIEDEIYDSLASSQIPNEELSSKIQHHYKLLIVDDNPSVRDLLKLQLESKYDLFFANNGVEGLDKSYNIMPDLIISDVMMPFKDGYELCKILKTDIQTSHIPIILLSAKVDQNSVIEGLNSKADIYLKKPFDFQELSLTIENLIGSKKELHQKYKGMSSKQLSDENSLEDNFIIKFKSIVLNNLLNSDFKISDLCKELNISRAGLHNKIKALTGLSTSNYINHIRIHKAKELLENNDINISEVSYKIGIINTNYFSRVFKKEFGMSPTEFRERHTKLKT